MVERGTPARGAADGWYPRTFLLTDVVDSVLWWERDPAAMSQAIAWHEAVIRDAVDSTGGEMVRTKGEGDSTFSVFTHPALGGYDAHQSEFGGVIQPAEIAID